jgi:seryl-tRNA synthetase
MRLSMRAMTAANARRDIDMDMLRKELVAQRRTIGTLREELVAQRRTIGTQEQTSVALREDSNRWSNEIQAQIGRPSTQVSFLLSELAVTNRRIHELAAKVDYLKQEVGDRTTQIHVLAMGLADTQSK